MAVRLSRILDQSVQVCSRSPTLPLFTNRSPLCECCDCLHWCAFHFPCLRERERVVACAYHPSEAWAANPGRWMEIWQTPYFFVWAMCFAPRGVTAMYFHSGFSESFDCGVWTNREPRSTLFVDEHCPEANVDPPHIVTGGTRHLVDHRSQAQSSPSCSA